jgi:hypothetical protein
LESTPARHSEAAQNDSLAQPRLHCPQWNASRVTSTQRLLQQVKPLVHVVVQGARQTPVPHTRVDAHSESLWQVAQSCEAEQVPLRQSVAALQPRRHDPWAEQYVPASQVSLAARHCTQVFRVRSQNGVGALQ